MLTCACCRFAHYSFQNVHIQCDHVLNTSSVCLHLGTSQTILLDDQPTNHSLSWAAAAQIAPVTAPALPSIPLPATAMEQVTSPSIHKRDTHTL